MPSWQGKSKGTPLGYRIFVAVIKRAGVLPAYILLRFVAFYYFLFSFSSSKIIYRFYRYRLHQPVLRSLLNLYRNYYIFGQTLIDKIAVMAVSENKFTYNFDGEDILRQVTAQQKGGMLLSAHIGNWEIAGFLLRRLNTKINIVIFDGEHERIKQYLGSVTQQSAAKFIILRNDLSHIYEIAAALKNNELVCMHADRFLEGNKTLTVDFLGRPAKFPLGPFLLAAQFKVPVSFVFAMKESALHYHFFASPVKNLTATTKEAAMQQMLHAFSTEMEQKVKTYPQQWFNYYDFWQ
ncbi:lipid A biosynthesis acyltransferase [Panacibacter sp. DH6]|uniref:Lipid A biosynthesis acyltransferase n=1 Tax=Panacibacter microcysteis TaxID=2793269 RepID=A0A931E7T0_9BACT|nr:lipid A biosynthesis acyltransferase [Panacibacter microcysteis]MBG9376673.1 lipid A biosynthesis acyltransferase [Panacibacter microcysteis]